MSILETTDPKKVILECGRSRDKPIVISLPCLVEEESEEILKRSMKLAQEIDDYSEVMRAEMEKHIDFSKIAEHLLSETSVGGQG